MSENTPKNINALAILQFLHHYQKNRYRIYRVEITKLRPYRVTTRWGRKTPKNRKPRGTGTKEKEFESIQTALKTYETILNQKSKRGYNVSTASAL